MPNEPLRHPPRHQRADAGRPYDQDAEPDAAPRGYPGPSHITVPDAPHAGDVVVEVVEPDDGPPVAPI